MSVSHLFLTLQSLDMNPNIGKGSLLNIQSQNYFAVAVVADVVVVYVFKEGGAFSLSILSTYCFLSQQF